MKMDDFLHHGVEDESERYHSPRSTPRIWGVISSQTRGTTIASGYRPSFSWPAKLRRNRNNRSGDMILAVAQQAVQTTSAGGSPNTAHSRHAVRTGSNSAWRKSRKASAVASATPANSRPSNARIAAFVTGPKGYAVGC